MVDQLSLTLWPSLCLSSLNCKMGITAVPTPEGHVNVNKVGDIEHRGRAPWQCQARPTLGQGSPFPHRWDLESGEALGRQGIPCAFPPPLSSWHVPHHASQAGSWLPSVDLCTVPGTLWWRCPCRRHGEGGSFSGTPSALA